MAGSFLCHKTWLYLAYISWLWSDHVDNEFLSLALVYGLQYSQLVCIVSRNTKASLSLPVWQILPCSHASAHTTQLWYTSTVLLLRAIWVNLSFLREPQIFSKWVCVATSVCPAKTTQSLLLSRQIGAGSSDRLVPPLYVLLEQQGDLNYQSLFVCWATNSVLFKQGIRRWQHSPIQKVSGAPWETTDMSWVVYVKAREPQYNKSAFQSPPPKSRTTTSAERIVLKKALLTDSSSSVPPQHSV